MNSAEKTDRKQAADVETCISNCKSKFNQILNCVLDAEQMEAHRMEENIFKQLLELGLLLLELFFKNHNCGDYGKTINTARGEAKRGKKNSKTYFSIFGKIKVIRYLYHTENETFAPLDNVLNLPARCYSYFLSEMINILNIRGAYLEGVKFLERFFGKNVSVSASETISAESSECYKDFYEVKENLPGPVKNEDYTVVSFDGKGVPMIKEEAAKIKGRQGKGEKKQKKKEALVGVRYNINANQRTADEVANNLIYPEDTKDKKENEKERAQDIRYIASVETPKKEVMEEIYESVKDEDYTDTNPLVCIMDGAAYLWKIFEETFKNIESKILILDIIHVIEYIWLIAHIHHKIGSKKAYKYVYEKLLLILKGGVSLYIAELEKELEGKLWQKSKKEKFEKVIAYLKNHQQYMKYDEFLECGYPIGTGVVESACGHVVKNRMEIAGARWGIKGSEAILRLRSIERSKDWDEYWNYFTQHARNNSFFADGYELPDIYEKLAA